MVITPWLGTLWGASDADPSPETEPHSAPPRCPLSASGGWWVGVEIATPAAAMMTAQAESLTLDSA